VSVKPRAKHPLKLTHAEEYRAVLAGECRLSGKCFLLRAEVNALTGARLGLIASRKAARRAVDRNRAKRLAREAFRAVRCGLPAVDMVLQVKNDLRTTGNANIRKELNRLIRDAAARFGADANRVAVDGGVSVRASPVKPAESGLLTDKAS
jgi:ribonuclease P protein component